MPDDDWGEKTEDPTAKRRSDAREKGQVAKSGDLNTAVLFLAAFLALWMFGPAMLDGLSKMSVWIFESLSEASINAQDVVYYTRAGALYCVAIIAPLLVTILLVAILINAVQVGFLVSMKSFQPKLTRVSPLSGFKRIFSMRNLVRFGMSLIKVSVVFAVLVWTLWTEVPNSLALLAMSPGQTTVYTAERIFVLAMRTAMVLLAIGFADMLYQRWQHEQELKMSKQEVKDEMKQLDGDPKVKERRRELHRRLAQQRMMKSVPKAHVVVTNPTHFAVALRYEPEEKPAPEVLAKGADLMAQRIREIALEHGIPIVQQAPLAQALFRRAEVGDLIPPDLYEAVAKIIAYVWGLEGKLPGRKAA